MLAPSRRLRQKADFSRTVREGTKVSTRSLVVYRLAADHEARFGFIVSGKVGNAVKRNRVKRQLRHMAAQSEGSGDYVVRALPGAAELSGAKLRGELDFCLGKLHS